MSRSLARTLHRIARLATAPLRQARRASTLALLHEATLQRVEVPSSAGPLTIICPSNRSLHDPYGFGRDEPETVAWIESLPADAVLWDIGANVGLYTVFAGRRGLRVLAFEPSAQSFAAMQRNLEANGLDGVVEAYCLALDATPGLARLAMHASEAGHAMHGIRGVQGARFSQAVPAISVDGFVLGFGATPPTHIKLDVDGIEPAVLEGAREMLLRHVREVLVELEGENQRLVPGYLASLGFNEVPGEGRNRLFRR
ncbi:FkbM family methyltransferase [Rhodovarius crocodyli]|uniref:FkbM family methyltransferase n=1 Tax=Rhodovarius crocodyli TaxID=1979269 RepID=A0A437M1X5_9PROT|nr:FkbM family methyltransferase [Rhodovarius crocodyli]RVT91586.1 FkbM family methyltransferase [Rhodovarius crocodyli]